VTHRWKTPWCSRYFIDTVGDVLTLDVNGSKVGYIDSAMFIRTSEEALDEAIATMVEEQPTDIILDFRYNGGGYVYIAQKLAAQLIGPAFTGEVFQNTEFNNKYSQFNRSSEYEPQQLNLSLPRVIILTTGRTASASEAIANNISPYVEVVLIGTETRGKPFASVSNPNCELSLSAMDRITSNQVGETVLGGLQPTCEVADTWLHPKSSPNDSLMGAAISYLTTNTCPAPAAIADGGFRANFIHAPIDDFAEPEFPSGIFDSIDGS